MAVGVVMVVGADPLESIGGHSSYVRAHARAAVKAGFHPHLFCVSRSSGSVQTDFGVVHRTPSPWRLRGQRGVLGFRHHLIWLHEPLLAASVERFLGTRPGPHLIHSFGLWGCVGVRVRRRLARLGIEAISVVSAYTILEHEFRAKLNSMKWRGGVQWMLPGADLLMVKWVIARYERRAYAGARRVLVNYESVRRLLREAYGIEGTLRKVPYTAESAFLHEESEGCREVPKAIASLERGEAPLVVSVSRHDPRKGVHILLQALARLRAAGVSFRACLVGGGLLLAAHRRVAERLGLGDVVAIEGFVPDPYPFLQHADVFVLPSLEEGSGSLSLIEALQAGVAVVASNVDGIPEDVVDGENGILVPPGDEAALAVAIGRLITDPALRQTLGRSARATFEARFSAATFVDALRKTYAELGVTR